MTEQTQTGQKSSKNTVDKRYDEIKTTIDSYYQQVKLGSLVSNNEVEKFLTLGATERRKLDPRQAAEAALILTQQAAYIQTEINRHIAVQDWCTEQIDGIVSTTFQNYGSQYTPKEYKRKAAIRESDAATKLERIRLHAQLRINTLNYLPTYLHRVAQSYEVLARTFVGREIQ
jgi:hypothetical protein